jgi:hypothetical protein
VFWTHKKNVEKVGKNGERNHMGGYTKKMKNEQK